MKGTLVKMPRAVQLKDILSRFLLVFLSIETILQELTIYRRRQKLRVMKNGLDLRGAYEATLRRIKAQGGEKARLGMAVLMWVSHSRRPLQVEELCHAIAIRIGSTHHNSDDIPTLSTLINCCQGLVTLEKSGSTIRLIHFTLQEYLHAHFNRAHSIMAETCLTYLNFQHIKDISAQPPSNLRDTPFLEYSSLYWGTHMRMEVSDCSKTLALQLLDLFDGHISAKYLWNSINGWLPSYQNRRYRPFSALHCIAYFGVTEVAKTLLEMNRWDVNKEDDAGTTPLIWAAIHGHEEVVSLLLRNEYSQPDRHDSNFGRTALSWAAENGHEGVVKLLLGRKDVNPDSLSNSGQTPLLLAARNGHEGILRLLLGRKDVNPDITDMLLGRTPLSWAAEDGHDGTVKLLLARKDVNPDNLSNSGQTPLSWAAWKGREGIVKLLLGQKDVNPEITDTLYGQTPLSWAAENGHESTVKLLLSREDVNPNTSSKSGQTPLTLAANNGHHIVVELLQTRHSRCIR